jgi:hypothetical protein
MSTSGRRARSAGEELEPGKRPKKVNSEIRKQQNRIASRNYSRFHLAPSSIHQPGQTLTGALT